MYFVTNYYLIENVVVFIFFFLIRNKIYNIIKIVVVSKALVSIINPDWVN